METEEVLRAIAVPLIVAILGSGSVSAIVAAWIENMKQKRVNPVAMGVKLLLQDRIEGLCIKYIKAGEIKYENLRYLRQAHDCYHNYLRGNGDLKELMEEVEKLPIVYPPKK